MDDGALAPTGRVAPRGRFRKRSRYTLEPGTGNLVVMREFLRATLEPTPAGPHLFEIVSATHEACKNAVCHNPDLDIPIDIVCDLYDDSVVVEVKDRGSGFDSSALPQGPPQPDALAGRGIFLIYSLMDAVETSSGEGGTTVVMQKKF